jgi:hypothetical protein
MPKVRKQQWSRENVELIAATASAANGSRDKSWRWVKGLYLHNKRLYESRLDEPLVVRLAIYIRDKAELDPVQLQRRYPDLFEVDQIFEQESLRRWQLEAMVCGLATQQQIADYLHLTVRAVDLYEKVFFDVRERVIKSRGWVNSELLGNSLVDPQHKDTDGLWKRYALDGGLGVLMSQWQLGFVDEASQEWLSKMGRGEMIKQTARAMITFRPTVENQTALAGEDVKHRLMEQNMAAKNDTEGDRIRAQMAPLLPQMSPSAKQKSDYSADEPRSDNELMELVKVELESMQRERYGEVVEGEVVEKSSN